MRKFITRRKPIYIVEISASAKDFAVTSDIFKHFVSKNPQYADCNYDSTYSNGTWTLRLFRECAIDFVE